ncbi:MAG: hypothetical protein CVT92_11670 [Bacteroidetes bacterium HGW-Bacteroidetes-1]|jgi:hypothetical protein|nr:MAG: hypothetical protein CVT92_11670 [Bacteroidetes bacterium HGW-Bacteroidetes-1]
MRIIFLFSLFIFLVNAGFAQQCEQVNHLIYDNWKDVSKPVLSNDGKWVSFELNPQKGDGKLIIYDLENRSYDTISRGYDAKFLPDSKTIIFKIKPPYAELRKQKLDGVKNEKLLKDSLAVFFLGTDSIRRFSNSTLLK